MMEYKGYTAKVAFDDEAEIFHGEVIGGNDSVTKYRILTNSVLGEGFLEVGI